MLKMIKPFLTVFILTSISEMCGAAKEFDAPLAKKERPFLHAMVARIAGLPESSSLDHLSYKENLESDLTHNLSKKEYKLLAIKKSACERLQLVFVGGKWHGDKRHLHVGISSSMQAKDLSGRGEIPSELKEFVINTVKGWKADVSGGLVASVVGYKMGGTIASQAMSDQNAVLLFPDASVITFDSATIKESSDAISQCHFMTTACPEEWKKDHNPVSRKKMLKFGTEIDGYTAYLNKYSNPCCIWRSEYMLSVIACLLDDSSKEGRTWDDLLK